MDMGMVRWYMVQYLRQYIETDHPLIRNYYNEIFEMCLQFYILIDLRLRMMFELIHLILDRECLMMTNIPDVNFHN